MTKLFVFDLGNVILPFEHRQIATKLHNRSRVKAGFSPPEMFNFMFDIGAGLIDTYEEGLMSSEEFFERLKGRFQLDMTFHEFAVVWNEIFKEDKEVSRAIQYLHDKGYPLFLLSNTNELHFSYIIEEYPVVHTFDEWILSFEVGAKKPARRIYDVIFEKADVEPEEVFYIDDVREYVETAREMGVQGLVFESAGQLWRTLREKMV